MIDFSPLHGWRYNPSKVRFEEVLAPPYDVISPEYQDKLYRQSPYNCVRLILNKKTAQDTPQDNRYTRSRDTFHEWCRDGILIQDAMPLYYFYRQTFKDYQSQKLKTRTAILGRLKLQPSEKGGAVAHERTLSGPREDRRKLIEATNTNFSPVFGLYEDQQGKIGSMLPELTAGQPVFDITDREGIGHALWTIKGAGGIQFLRDEFSQKKIYIADGHHRYQTALDFAQKKRKEADVPELMELDSDYVLMALVAFEDSGLVLFPTHRLITSFENARIRSIQSGSPEKLLEPLRDYFQIKKLSVSEIKNKLNHPSQDQTELGLLFPETAYLLTVSDWGRVKEKMTPGKPEIWYRLDVSVITNLILQTLWAIPEANWESVIYYTHSDEEVVTRVQNKEVAAAFLLRTPKVQILREMGKVGELMPQKSTYFYPKLASGLVFYHHSI